MTTNRPHADAMPRHDDLIRAWLADLALRGCSPRTIRLYRVVSARAQRDLPHGMAEATPDELRSWLATWPSPATRRTYRGMLTSFFRWATLEGHLDYDSTLRIPRVKTPQRLPHPATHDQVTAILNAAPEPVRTWALIAAYTGARCIEISRLDRRDITPDMVVLDGKGDKQRAVPTHPALWAALEHLPAGPVAPYTEHRISTLASTTIRQLCADSWRPRITMHRLRSWYATTALAATGDLRAVQQLLGHASPSTTAIYAQAMPAALSRAVAGLPDLTTPVAAGGAAPAPVAAAAPRR